MKKFALGVHHFNLLYVAGQQETYHRQVREAISPFLDLLIDHPTWHVNVELQGYAIVYMATHYPDVLERLSYLINEREQVELISCQYAPQMWVVYPKYDMQKSIQINDAILDRYGLKRSRIFFAQENFSGEGVLALSEYFDSCVLKDDYYYPLHGVQDVRPYYALKNMKVLIGTSHIQERILELVFPDVEEIQTSDLIRQFNIVDFLTLDHLKNHKQKLAQKNIETIPVGQYDDLIWEWYHVGSSESFSKCLAAPQDVWRCWRDPSWMALAEQVLMNLEQSGYRLSTLGDFMAEVAQTGYHPEPLKPMLDGCWNIEQSKGVYQWMGFYGQRYEADRVVLSHAWRTRARLLACECVMGNSKFRHHVTQEDRDLIQQAWQYQLLAEGSDSTGWWPTPDEVQFSINQADKAANLTAKVISRLKNCIRMGRLSVDTHTGEVVPFRDYCFPTLEEADLATCFANGLEVFGCRGQIALYRVSNNTQRLTVLMKPIKRVCGIGFDLETRNLRYSPALMEDQLVSYPLCDFQIEEIFLPLPNGLIGLGEDTYAIKHNDTMHVACCIDKKARKIRFQVENTNGLQNWTLTLFQGTEEQALQLANQINVFPMVIL